MPVAPFRRFLTGFTLTELMVVMIIIGILAAVAVPNYTLTREKAIDKEATAALRMIQAANRQFYAQYESYFPASGTVNNVALINNNLSLDLNATRWTFAVANVSGGYNATASRSARTWYLNQTSAEPLCTGTCL